MDYKTVFSLLFTSFLGLSTLWSTPLSPGPISPVITVWNSNALREIGYHNTPIPKAIKSVNLSKNSSVGVYIENPNPGESFAVKAIKARLQAARGKKGTIKLHLYEFSGENKTVSDDLLSDEYTATVDQNGNIRNFPINQHIELSGAGILVVIQWVGGSPVQIPAGETSQLKSNVNYNIPNPANIGKGTKASQILQHQVLDTQHPLTIGLAIE